MTSAGVNTATAQGAAACSAVSDQRVVAVAVAVAVAVTVYQARVKQVSDFHALQDWVHHHKPAVAKICKESSDTIRTRM